MYIFQIQSPQVATFSRFFFAAPFWLACLTRHSPRKTTTPWTPRFRHRRFRRRGGSGLCRTSRYEMQALEVSWVASGETRLHSLKLTAKAPENRPDPKGNDHIPTIHFQVRAVSFRKGKDSFLLKNWWPFLGKWFPGWGFLWMSRMSGQCWIQWFDHVLEEIQFPRQRILAKVVEQYNYFIDVQWEKQCAK